MAQLAAKERFGGPIERFCIAPTDHKGLVLGFSGIKPPEIIDGARVLAEALEKLAP
jgi:hypothetical protein